MSGESSTTESSTTLSSVADDVFTIPVGGFGITVVKSLGTRHVLNGLAKLLDPHPERLRHALAEQMLELNAMTPVEAVLEIMSMMTRHARCSPSASGPAAQQHMHKEVEAFLSSQQQHSSGGTDRQPRQAVAAERSVPAPLQARPARVADNLPVDLDK